MTDKRIIDNQRYNAERRAQAELMKRDLDRDQVLAKIYQEGYDRMQAQIDQFYMSYAGQNGLTKQEAIKRVSEFDVIKFNQKAAEAVRNRDFSPETNSWLKTYNLKMRVSRLELLKAELGLEIQNLTAEANEVFDKARRDEQLAEFKRQAGILGNSATGSKKRLEAILDADFYGQTFSSRVWGGLGLRATLQRDVFGSLNRIFTDMMGYKQERDRLAKKFGTSKANAQRLLKTEIARINADTQLAMLKDNDFTHMIFVAEPGACDLCGPLDQKAIPIDQVENGVNMFPMHPNCRCSAYGHIELKRKDGTSTLDEYELWEGNRKPAEKQGQKQITGEGRKLLGHTKGRFDFVNIPELPAGVRWNVETGQFEIKGSAGAKTTSEVIKCLEEAKVKNGDRFNAKASRFLDWLKKQIFDESVEKVDYEVYNRFKFDRKFSAAELAEKLRTEFGMAVSETSRTKLPQLALEQTYSILKSFENVYNALPEKIPQVRALPKTKAGNAIAWYSRIQRTNTPVEFGINVSQFLNDKILKETVEYNVKVGFFSKNSSPEHIMIHEFGHHIDFQLSKLTKSQFSDDVFREMEKLNPEKYSYSEVGKLTGGYAQSHYQNTQSNTETFAELFAEAYGDTPREIADDFRNVLEQRVREVLDNAKRT